MSEINANIVVEQIGANITVQENNINITPEDISLRIFAGGYGTPGGNVEEVQFNNGGILGGNPTFLFNVANTRVTVNNFVATSTANLGNVGNVTITGGSANYLLQTDGAGNLNWVDYQSVANANYANFAGQVVDATQSNITSLGTLTSLDVTGNITAGNANLGNAVTANYFIGDGSLLTGIDLTKISNGNSNVQVYGNSNVAITVAGNANIVQVTGTGVNVAGYLEVNGNIAFSGAEVNVGSSSNLIITGGVNGYFLQTDGTGNLTWAAGGNATGNGTPGGANTQIQYNDAGNFGGSVGFTFDNTSNLFSAPGDANIVGNVTANLFIGNLDGQANTANIANVVSNNAQPNITSLGTLTGLGVNGNITAANITANTGIFTGNGSGLSAIAGANVTGTVANATHASTANTVTDAAQPNITSVGTLTGLGVNGTLSLYEAIENVALISNQTGTYNFDLFDGAIQFATANATANLTLNFRANSTTTANSILANGKSITSTFVMTTGTNPYTITNVQIDGAASNIKWAGNSIPLTYANALQSYTFTIIKTSTTPTFVVLGNFTRYG